MAKRQKTIKAGRGKVKVTTNFAVKDNIGKFWDRATAKQVGGMVVDESLRFIGKGKSPVQGVGRFKAYQAQRMGTKRLRKKLRKTPNTPENQPARKSISREIRSRERQGYPWTVRDKFPNKKVRPVNLKLSGEMLKHFTFWIGKEGKDKFLNVGYKKSAPRKVLERVEKHQLGIETPARQFIPQFRGEKYIVSIQRKIVDLMSRRINKLIKPK